MTVLKDLERAWPELEASAVLDERLRRWADGDMAFAGVADVAGLRRALAADPLPEAQQRRDGILLGLLDACQAPGPDAEWARRLTLQLLLPTCRRLAGRLWLLPEPDDREQLVITELLGLLAGWTERPRRCVAFGLVRRLTARVFRVLYAQCAPQGEVLIPPGDGLYAAGDLDDPYTDFDDRGQSATSGRHRVHAGAPERGVIVAGQPPSAAEQVLAIVVDATRRGVLPRDHAQLIVDRRVRGIRLADTCAARTASYAAVQRRFARAEHRLIDACHRGVVRAA